MGLSKRGQGVYILIGAVLLVMFVFGFYVHSSRVSEQSSKEQKKVLEESIIPSVNFYMKESMKKAGKGVIEEIGEQGGSLDPEPSMLKGGVTEIAYTCYEDEPGRACINTMITRQGIENEIAAKIEDNLDSIIDLSRFREEGVKIDEGSRDVDVMLGKTSLVVELNYPLTLRMGDNKSVEKVDTFQATIDLPLGLLYDMASYITDTETQEKEFNITEWYQKHPDLMVSIEREELGDEQLFQLVKDDFIYNFAIQQGQSELEEADYGCCYNRYDSLCFKNVPEERCEEIGGEYDPDSRCLCPVEGELSCVMSLENAGCTEDYTEVLRLSDYENAHIGMPDSGQLNHSLCCDVVDFYITQEPDEVEHACEAPNSAVFARVSSGNNRHISDPGAPNSISIFNRDLCISAKNSRITCRVRQGNCLGDEDPLISLMKPESWDYAVNTHAGYGYKYDTKICCKAEEIE
ncbi:MAG: hypothetical protein R6U32_07885 [Candidatus Woesearchaeota archaeon]